MSLRAHSQTHFILMATMQGKVLIAATVAVLFVLLWQIKSWLLAKPTKLIRLPPGPWTLPVIGGLHHLVTTPLIFRSLRGLSKKHGPLMTLRLGEVPALVVSSPEAAEAVLKTHDVSFADRLANRTMSVLSFDGAGVNLVPYDERWRQLRKICVMELLSAARVDSFRRVREEEVSLFMDSLAASSAAGAVVDMSKLISKFVNDTFVRESVGSRCSSEYQDEYLDALDAAMRQTSVLSVADLFPSSRLMQMLGTAPRKALASRRRIQRILERIMQETVEHQAAAACHEGGLVGVLLNLQKEGGTAVPLTNDTIIAVMFDMFGAGSHTSATTLIWCMTELVRSPSAMARAQAEVRAPFKGRKTTLTEDDVTRLQYLKLVIKETLRLHAPVPLIPRQCRETCEIMGYYISKGTAVFVNVWAMNRDPNYWDDPEEFKPERFENSNLDYKGSNFKFLPFGAGRRSCPGSNLGLANIELALASLLYHFDWKLPDGMEPKDVDVQEVLGLVAKKKTSLILQPITRIAPGKL